MSNKKLNLLIDNRRLLINGKQLIIDMASINPNISYLDHIPFGYDETIRELDLEINKLTKQYDSRKIISRRIT